MFHIKAQDTLVKTERRDLGIINYGLDNLYPNHSSVFAENSPTLHACLNVMNRFIFGHGMSQDQNFWKRKVNVFGLRVDQMLRQLVGEFEKHEGFAVVVQYNGMGEKVGYMPISFEKLRLGKPDDLGRIKKIYLCEDWSKTRIKDKDKKEYDVYNPEMAVKQFEMQGKEYKGQIFYYGKNGQLEYPYNSFHSVLEDVATDVEIKKGKYSNVKNNFLASHIMQVPFNFQDIADNVNERQKNEDKYYKEKTAEDVKSEIMQSLNDLQGNERLGQIMLVENTIKDEGGKMVEIKLEAIELQNYDKLNEYTEKSVKENIRQNFSIPAILMQETAVGFSTELFKEAYNYMNQITEYERQIFEETFSELFTNWTNDYSIQKLEYVNI